MPVESLGWSLLGAQSQSRGHLRRRSGGGGGRVVAEHHGSAFNKLSLPVFYDLGDRFITLRIGNFSGTRALRRKGPTVVHRTPSDWMN